ncbi:MAG: DNA double-strand break repair nuclease NurA, partial [Ardenticatenaceae bacterium]
MSLDLTKTALQIDEMASALKARHSDFRERMGRASDALALFDSDEYERKRQQSLEALFWNVPAAIDSPGSQFAPPVLPDDFCVVAVDGSHIDIDRHIPARCFLINIGAVVLNYGSRPDAQLSSRPKLYARDDELVIRDKGGSFREQSVEGGVLGVKRAVEELKALVEVVKELPPDVPTLGLLDGSLILFGVSESVFPPFVIDELVVEGYVGALDELRQLSSQRRLAIASYISLPRSQETVNALRVQVCPYDTPDCRQHCGEKRVGEKPCDKAVGGLMDRQVFREWLNPKSRSGLMESNFALIERHYAGHKVDFFYVNTGEE